MTTIADIAKKAGVSTAVVSRVINADASLRISDDTRKRVLATIKEMDYQPNLAARSLRSAKSGMIALAVHDLTNPVYAEIMRGAHDAAAKSRNAMLLFDASSSMESTARLVEMIGGGGLDGLIIQAAGGISDTVLARAARQKVPTVLLQAAMDIDAHLISLPDKEATQIATKYLIDLGHKEIGCVSTREGMSFTDARIEGWRSEMQTAGYNHDDRLIAYGSSEIEGGIAATNQLLDTAPELTGVVCFNVMAAIGALQVIEERGLHVPEDISVITLHEIPMAAHLKVPLTTIAMPLFEMGQRAVELVVAMHEYDTGTSSIDDVAPYVIPRESTAPPKHD